MTEIKLFPPCQGRITQVYGEHVDYYRQWGYCCGHNGIDWGINMGTPILASAGGKVSAVKFEQGGYGNYVKLDHKGYSTYYAHLERATVREGDEVGVGQQIALSDNTGASTGPHLHFGIKIPGAYPEMHDYVDPAPYLDLNISPHEPPVDGQNFMTVDIYGEVVIASLRVRNGAGTQYAHVGDVVLGDKFRIDAITGFVKNCSGEVWFRFAEGKHAGNWSAGIYAGETYVRQIEEIG